MKKITKPAQREEAVYYSDFSGKCFGEAHPPVELILDFGYGSGYDGSKLTLHLDDKDVEDILFLLKAKLSNETKKQFKEKLVKLEEDFDDSMQMRDWNNCDYICNSKELLERIV
jgi:hypothetical protein